MSNVSPEISRNSVCSNGGVVSRMSSQDLYQSMDLDKLSRKSSIGRGSIFRQYQHQPQPNPRKEGCEFDLSRPWARKILTRQNSISSKEAFEDAEQPKAQPIKTLINSSEFLTIGELYPVYITQVDTLSNFFVQLITAKAHEAKPSEIRCKLAEIRPSEVKWRKEAIDSMAALKRKSPLYAKIVSIDEFEPGSGHIETVYGIDLIYGCEESTITFLIQNALAKKQICVVCDKTTSTGFHFGAIVCDACKSFFRRANENPHKEVFTNKNTCQIHYSTTSLHTSCKPCRLARCLAAGMNNTGSFRAKKNIEATTHLKRTRSMTILKKTLVESQDGVGDDSNATVSEDQMSSVENGNLDEKKAEQVQQVEVVEQVIEQQVVEHDQEVVEREANEVSSNECSGNKLQLPSQSRGNSLKKVRSGLIQPRQNKTSSLREEKKKKEEEVKKKNDNIIKKAVDVMRGKLGFNKKP